MKRHVCATRDIGRDSFVNQLFAIIDRRKRQIYRERAENLIPVTVDSVGQERGRPFVKQLYLVTEDDTVVETSIRDYIRCNIEKMRLSREGNITDADWEAFQQALQSRWARIRSRVIRMRSGVAEQDVGFEVFTETTEGHREKLAGTDTEQVYLTSGTYHRLADLLTIGWHPRYEELMKELPEIE
jgi:C-terminal domain 7 of the ABC-three component (ABC-3C) systems